MKTETKEKAIDIIIKESEELKELTERYCTEESPKNTDELLDYISWKRTGLNARLDLLQALDIITIDEWAIFRRLLSKLI